MPVGLTGSISNLKGTGVRFDRSGNALNNAGTSVAELAAVLCLGASSTIITSGRIVALGGGGVGTVFGSGLGTGTSIGIIGDSAFVPNNGNISISNESKYIEGNFARIIHSGPVLSENFALLIVGDSALVENRGNVFANQVRVGIVGSNSRIMNSGVVSTTGIGIMTDGVNNTVTNTTTGHITGGSGSQFIVNSILAAGVVRNADVIESNFTALRVA